MSKYTLVNKICVLSDGFYYVSDYNLSEEYLTLTFCSTINLQKTDTLAYPKEDWTNLSFAHMFYPIHLIKSEA